MPTPTADAIARRIKALLPARGAVDADAMRTIVRRRLSPVSDAQFQAAVLLGRARGDFRVLPDGCLSHRCGGGAS